MPGKVYAKFHAFITLSTIISLSDLKTVKCFLTTHFTDMCIPHFFLASERRSTVDVRRRPGYKIWRLFKFSSILLSFKTRHWLFILIYIKFGIFKLEKAPNFVTRPASNVDRRTPFGSEKKMRNAHISEMRSKYIGILSSTSKPVERQITSCFQVIKHFYQIKKQKFSTKSPNLEIAVGSILLESWTIPSGRFT